MSTIRKPSKPSNTKRYAVVVEVDGLPKIDIAGVFPTEAAAAAAGGEAWDSFEVVELVSIASYESEE